MIKYNKLFLNSSIEDKFKIKFKICHFFYILNSLIEILSISILIPLISFILNIDNKFISINDIKFLKDTNDLTKIIILFFFTLIFFSLRSITQLFILSYQRKFIAKFQRDLSEKVFKRCIFIDLKDLQKTPLNEQVRNLTDTGILTKYTENLMLLNTNLILTFFLITFLFFYDYKITLFFITLFSILAFLYFNITNNFYYSTGREIRKRTSEILNNVYNSLNSLKEIIIDRKRKFFFNLFAENTKIQAYIDYKTSVYGYLPRIVGELFLAIAIISIFIYLFYQNNNNELTILNLSLFVVAGIRLLPSFVILTKSNQALKQSIFSTQRVFEIIKKPFKEEKESSLSLRLDFKKSIKLKNITYGYSKSKLILNKANLEIPKNKIIGLFGESGSGKSTLINLISGLLTPSKGSIYVDKINIFSKIHEWHNSIGYVPQDVFLIRDTLKNNIAFGIKNKAINIKKIKEVVEICQLGKLIKEKNKGLNFLISEKSTNISGGQKQRIGIARALYKEPKLLILDETTSSLDKDIESKILRNLKKKYKKMTIIIISHRTSTLKKYADYNFKIINKKLVKTKI